MGWIKTMNNNGVKTDRSRKEQDRREQEGRAILRYTEELRRELNFRLLTEHDSGEKDLWNKFLAPERVLYVESITVTDIRYPEKRKSRADGRRNRKNQCRENNYRKEKGTRLWQ